MKKYNKKINNQIKLIEKIKFYKNIIIIYQLKKII